MQKFEPPKQFITELGRLLAAQTKRGPATHQRQALLNLADYLRTARRHHGLTWAALAQATGKSEAEIYALEHGLLPYSQIDFTLLACLADVLGEEVETLILLMGRSVLSLPGRPNALVPNRLVLFYRTSSQRVDNWFTTLPGKNPLYKRCLNLVDSWRASRLFSYTRVNDGVGHRMRGAFALLTCLFFVWVSTYSLFGLLHAQSYATSSIPTFALPDPVTSAHPGVNQHGTVATSVSSSVSPYRATPGVKHRTLARSHRPITQAAVDLAEARQMTSIAVLYSSVPDSSSTREAQQCAFRTTRYNLCRV